jgi:CrcB protein
MSRGLPPGSLPVDPDIDPATDDGARWPTIVPATLGLVFAGGCLGGYARYAITTASGQSTYGFPWSTFGVNTVGAFVLGLVVVVAVQGPRWLRPLAGTGFCGGLTTFSALVVAADRMVAHDHVGTAIVYVAASAAAGIAAAWAGFRAACRVAI